MDNDFNGKRLLVVGAGIFQATAIRKAREMGMIVVTIDKNPRSMGFQFSDYYEVVSTHDKEAILTIAEKYKVNGIMTLSTEVAVVPVAYAAEKLKLPGITVEVAQKATNKYLMRKVFKEHNVPCPEFYLAKEDEDLKNIENELGYPLMVKPLRGYASKSVFKVNNKKELESAFHIIRDETVNGSVLIEEFMDGLEVGGESFMMDGLMKMIYITNKKGTEPPLYIPLGHSLPSRLPGKIQDEIREVIKKGIKALGVASGPVNFDVMVTKNGPVVIEMGARLGGNCLPTLVHIHSGIDTVRESIILSLGGNPLFKEKLRKPVGVRMLTSNVAGKIAHISGINEVKRKEAVFEVQFVYNRGDRINQFLSGADKMGYIIAVGENADEVEKKLDLYSEKIRITVS